MSRFVIFSLLLVNGFLFAGKVQPHLYKNLRTGEVVDIRNLPELMQRRIVNNKDFYKAVKTNHQKTNKQNGIDTSLDINVKRTYRMDRSMQDLDAYYLGKKVREEADLEYSAGGFDITTDRTKRLEFKVKHDKELGHYDQKLTFVANKFNYKNGEVYFTALSADRTKILHCSLPSNSFKKRAVIYYTYKDVDAGKKYRRHLDKKQLLWEIGEEQQFYVKMNERNYQVNLNGKEIFNVEIPDDAKFNNLNFGFKYTDLKLKEAEVRILQ